MKRYLFLLAVATLSLPMVAEAQTADNLLWRDTEDYHSRKNSVTLTYSFSASSNYNGWGMFNNYSLEYDRMLSRNFSISAIGIYAPLKGRATTDIYTAREKFWFAGAKLNYNLPVVRNWLYLRVGVGIGAGLHDIIDYSMGMPMPDDYPPQPEAPSPEDKVKLHFMVDMYWIFRATQWLDLRFAPLIISPSYIVIGPKLNAPFYNKAFTNFNFLTIGATVRF